MPPTPITKEGLENLKRELSELEDRIPIIRKAVQDAREKGDLKENAEYHAAREELAQTDSRILMLKNKISGAAIIDTSKIGGDTIVFGATVKLLDMEYDDEEEFSLVGEGEDDPLNNKILTTSPMGQALLTRKVGDEVEVPGPKKTFRYKVLEIRFG